MLRSLSIPRTRLIALRSALRCDAIVELFSTFPSSLCPACGGWRDYFEQYGIPRLANLANGVAIAMVHAAASQSITVAIGRRPDGFDDCKNTRLIVAIILSDSGKDAALILPQLIAALDDTRQIYELMRPQTMESFRKVVADLFRGGGAQIWNGNQRAGDAFLLYAFRVAVASNCSSVMFFADAVCDWRPLLGNFAGMKCIVVTENSAEEADDTNGAHILKVSSYSDHRLVQLRSAILLAMSRNLLKLDERVCCIGGLRDSGRFDSLLIVSVAEEYRVLLNARKGLIPAGVKPEVFERLVAIAHEIAMEGREGHPVGTMFVVGRHDQLRSHYRPLVLNPFHGYARHERNLLSPFMCETAKEFAALDGAFVIDGDGVLEAAGVMVEAPDSRSIAIQSGFGTRHTAAAAFTRAHDCLAIVVSQSSGQVSLFRNGQMLALTGKVIG